MLEIFTSKQLATLLYKLASYMLTNTTTNGVQYNGLQSVTVLQ